MDALQESLEADPDQDNSTSLSRLQTLLFSIREQWIDADISPEHPLKAELDACEKKLTIMERDVSAARTRSLPAAAPPTSSFSSSFTSTGAPSHHYIELPKIKVPTFNGDIMSWSTFWSTFRSTVDDRPELSDSQKLNYLRQAVKDPSLQLLLNSPMETPETYKEIVLELKDRFQKTREIHQSITKAITSLSCPKHTRADLRLLYDVLKTSISNLKLTKHYNIESFLSSLVYAILPAKLQLLWDQATKKDKGVPPIEQQLTFLKDHAETLPAATPHPTEKTPDPASKKIFPKRKDYAPAKGRNNILLLLQHLLLINGIAYSVPQKNILCFFAPNGHLILWCRKQLASALTISAATAWLEATLLQIANLLIVVRSADRSIILLFTSNKQLLLQSTILQLLVIRCQTP